MVNEVLSEFVDTINRSNQQLYGIKVLQNGVIIDEYNWEQDKPRNLYSVTKTILSIAVGLAIEENVIQLENTLRDLFPEYVNEGNKNSLSEVTLHHLLSLSIGQDNPYLMLDQRENLPTKDWVEYSLNRPFQYCPGSCFLYTNVGHYLAGVAIQDRVNLSLIDYLKPRIFNPLNIYIEKWETDPFGNNFGAGGISLTLSDLTKIAQFLLQDGKWGGTRLLNSDWINLSRFPHTKTDNEDTYTNYYGYGLWLDTKRGNYRIDGAFGQMALIIPDKSLVVAITAKEADNVQNVERIYNQIYPKL